MSDIPVTNDVPVPRDKRKTREYLPWDTLDYGDSFVLDVNLPSARQTASWATRRFPGKFFRAGIADGEVRIWRVATL